MSARIQPALMAGGSGTRLWPLSRRARPKQFLPLLGARSLFQETALRLDPRADSRFAAPLLIGGAAHAGLIERQLAEIGVAPAAIAIEPEPRNTAAVAAVAALWTQAHNPGALVLLAPADHRIDDADGFRRAVLAGAGAAQAGRIVVFGVRAASPHTGYGYIEAGEAFDAASRRVAAFAEKPDLATAKAYVAGGAHCWNAGVFLYSPETLLAELERHAPDVRAGAEAAFARAKKKGARLVLDAKGFARAPAISLDHAVMEKTQMAALVGPLDIGWSDVGAWSAIESAADDPRVVAIDSPGALVRTDGPLVALIGAGDLIVVATGDAVLVARKDRAEEVKAIVETLKARGRDDLL